MLVIRNYPIPDLVRKYWIPWRAWRLRRLNVDIMIDSSLDIGGMLELKLL